MTISMYQASLPMFVRMLRNLDAILAKGAVHAEAKKIDPAVLVASRLYPDMFTLARQVQIATDIVKGCAARLSGQEPPKYEDNETSFPELAERVQKTIAFLETVKPEQIDGTEDKQITLNMRSGDLTFDGLSYLTGFVIPNFYFHLTTAYNILRHNGVELGKMDFLGKP
ncbi:MAG: DUF1993 domain-containing protein [Gammaproteobacteria bacterium]